jgi:purine catabolism regulator
MDENVEGVTKKAFPCHTLSITLTLAEVVELDPLRRAEAQIVAAADQAGRTVRWVHSAEVLDIAQFLGGGELLLTTGIELTKGPEKRKMKR